MAEMESDSTHTQNTIELQAISLTDASRPPCTAQPKTDVETSASGLFRVGQRVIGPRRKNCPYAYVRAHFHRLQSFQFFYSFVLVE